ncbi:MAG: SGNH/GDSL hydrolase family protein, partial [Microbacterium sp.]
IDTNFTPVFRGIRGRVAIYNENIRAIADRYDCIVADQWALKEVQDMRFFDDDRLHYNALGHHEVARMVLRALNVPNDLQPMQPDPFPTRTWREARAVDFVWAREYLVPWVLRRLRHQSSGDTVSAKRPDALPVTTLAPARDAGASLGEDA